MTKRWPRFLRWWRLRLMWTALPGTKPYGKAYALTFAEGKHALVVQAEFLGADAFGVPLRWVTVDYKTGYILDRQVSVWVGINRATDLLLDAERSVQEALETVEKERGTNHER